MFGIEFKGSRAIVLADQLSEVLSVVQDFVQRQKDKPDSIRLIDEDRSNLGVCHRDTGYSALARA